MRPTNSIPAASAPPVVHSNPNLSKNGTSVQMSTPFGAGNGIGFSNLVNNSPVNAQSSPYPSYPQGMPQVASYPSYPQTNFPPQQVSSSQGHPPHSHFSQTPSAVYPNLNQSTPFSYTQPRPVMHRSTSGYMRQVIGGSEKLDETFK